MERVLGRRAGRRRVAARTASRSARWPSPSASATGSTCCPSSSRRPGRRSPRPSTADVCGTGARAGARTPLARERPRRPRGDADPTVTYATRTWPYTPDRLVLLDWGLGTCGHAVGWTWPGTWSTTYGGSTATHDQVVEDFRARPPRTRRPTRARPRADLRPGAIRLDLRAQRSCAHRPARTRMGTRGTRLVGATCAAGPGRLEVAG